MSNPFELRFSIFTQAEGRLLQKYYSDVSIWESGKERGENSRRPTFPTHEDILNEAEKIYDFVQNKIDNSYSKYTISHNK